MNLSFNTSSANHSFLNISTSKRHGHGVQDKEIIMSEGASHILEHFGPALPSMVRVVLNKVQDPKSVSFKLDRNGWAWLVWKRHLYIWRYVLDTKKATIPCRELLLPPSELFHNAKLVSVVITNSSVPACIAVTPEGYITYWPNISSESATVSINADLPGQECDSLTSIWPIGCILATTSATVLLIKPGLGAKHSLTCTGLSLGTKGWLGGLSKKMAYLMPMGTTHVETKRAIVAPIGRDDRRQLSSTNIYIIAGTNLQVWSINPEGQQCISDYNLDDVVRRLFHREIWDEKSDLRGIQIWLLDINVEDPKKVKILAAGMNRSEESDMLNYGIVTLDGTQTRIREGVNLKVVNYRCPKGEGEEDNLYAWKLLSTHQYSFMISHDKILIVSDEMGLDTLNSDQLGGPFIGSGLSAENIPLIFTTTHGLFALRVNQSLEGSILAFNETMADIRVPDHLALSMTQHNVLDMSMSEDSVNVYKSAFLHFCAKRMDECMNVLESLFPQVPSMSPHNPIDTWTLALCEKLIDDAPITDPRWSSSLGRTEMEDPLGLKSKMLIKNFLADKKKGLEIFFAFLRATQIWSRLGGVVVKDSIQATGSALYNSYEKIGFAMVLHFLQTDGRYRKVVDPGIKSIVTLRHESRYNSALSFNDVFFKDISRIHQILPALVSLEEEVLEGGDSRLICDSVSITTEVILILFAELRSLLEKDFAPIRHAFLLPLLDGSTKYEVSPWYIQAHSYEALTKQADLLVTGSQLAETAEERMDFFKQLEQLTDLLLDALKLELESLKYSERYPQKLTEFEGRRSDLLGNLVQMDPIGTISLAEKYLDFNILVSVTYVEKDLERLLDFFEKYYDIGFPFYTFEWYLKQKKEAELIEFFSKSKYSSLLSDFLKDYPNIAWRHSALNDDFYGTSKTLSSLADNEESSVDDKKFLLCMSKLALLATGTENPEEDLETYNGINRRLDIVRFQNELSDAALEAHGMSRDNMHVLSPSQLIDIYTSNQIEPEVSNFWKAALLAQYLPTASAADEKRLLITARAILSEPWASWDIDHPLDVIEASILYKFLTFVISNGEDMNDYFQLESLSNMDILQDVFSQPNAKYLLSACREHLLEQDVPM